MLDFLLKIIAATGKVKAEFTLNDVKFTVNINADYTTFIYYRTANIGGRIFRNTNNLQEAISFVSTEIADILGALA